MKIIFFDTETTGNTDQDRLCQLAIKERGIPTPILNAIFQPPIPISIEAMAIHHITQKMVKDKPLFKEASEYADTKALFENGDVISVAHNAAFDLRMLAHEDVVPRASICTYKVANALDPQDVVESYSLQYLRYLLGLEVEAVAHDAWGDALVLEAVFERLLSKMVQKLGTEDAAIREILTISSRPLLFTTIRFGKYKGKKIEELVRTDPGYLQWLLQEKRKNATVEADWIYTLEHHLSFDSSSPTQ